MLFRRRGMVPITSTLFKKTNNKVCLGMSLTRGLVIVEVDGMVCPCEVILIKNTY